MTDKKISELTQITGADVDDANDELAIVDASVSETKAITRAELFSSIDSVDINGDLTVDTDTLFVDASTDQVGIGVSSPRAPLHLSPSGGASDNFNFLVSQFRPNIVLEDLSSGATDWQLFAEGGELQFRYGDASTDTKLTNEAVRIDSDGVIDIVEGSVVLNGSALSAIQVTVSDDSVAELTFTNRRVGMLSLVEGANDDIFPDNGVFFQGYVDFGDSAAVVTSIKGGGTDVDTSNTLTGTTGTDGNVTIGAAGTSGVLYIENRAGGSRTFNITLL